MFIRTHRCFKHHVSKFQRSLHLLWRGSETVNELLSELLTRPDSRDSFASLSLSVTRQTRRNKSYRSARCVSGKRNQGKGSYANCHTIGAINRVPSFPLVSLCAIRARFMPGLLGYRFFRQRVLAISAPVSRFPDLGLAGPATTKRPGTCPNCESAMGTSIRKPIAIREKKRGTEERFHHERMVIRSKLIYSRFRGMENYL